MRAKQKNRIRKSTKYILMSVAVIIFLISLNGIFNYSGTENEKTNNKEIYTYTNKFNYDYNVNLIKNKYINQEQIENKNLVYVTDLIDTISLDLNYDYIANKAKKLMCEYEIIGKMKAVYTKNGEEQTIIDNEEILLSKKQIENVSNKININEKLELTLKEKNNLLDEFKKEMGMQINATYTVMLKVNVKTNVENEDVNAEYTPEIQIDLAEKTTKITGENNKEVKNYIYKEYQTESKENIPYILVNVVLLVASVILFKYCIKAKTIKVVKNEFREELNKILKICDDKIVQVSTKPDEKDKEIVYVKEFEEIYKVSEELFKPILYYYNVLKEEAWFSVKSGNTTYLYILKNK